jgi:hypothetical protein
VIGRFAQVDPLADMFGQQSVSPYSAFWNNPATFEDKWGLVPQDGEPNILKRIWNRVRTVFGTKKASSETNNNGGIPDNFGDEFSNIGEVGFHATVEAIPLYGPPRIPTSGLWGHFNYFMLGGNVENGYTYNLEGKSTGREPISGEVWFDSAGTGALKLLKNIAKLVKGGRTVKGVIAPKGWITQASKKGGGTVFKDPSNPHNIIRQMPGNPSSPNVLQQNPYVKFMKDGKFYEINGKVLPNGNVPGAHIPLNQFNIKNMPKF